MSLTEPPTLEGSNLSPYIDDDDVDPSKDDVPRFEVPVGGNKLIAERLDPYGFWYIHFERGVTPAMLGGAWTTKDRAQAAIQSYIVTKKKEKPEAVSASKLA